MVESVFPIFHSPHDIADFLARQTEIIQDAAHVADTLLNTIVPVQGAVARRLVSVEITLREETGNAVLQNAQITCVRLAVVARICVTGVIKVYVPTYIGNRRTIISIIVNAVAHQQRPYRFTHILTPRGRSGTIIMATEDKQRVIGDGTFGSRIGVDGEEEVEITRLHFLAYFREIAVAYFRIGSTGHIRERAIRHTGMHDVLLAEAILHEFLA